MTKPTVSRAGEGPRNSGERNVSLQPSFEDDNSQGLSIMKKSMGSDTSGTGVSKPSEGQTQGKTPQGGGERSNGKSSKGGGRDSSQSGGQND